MLSRKSIYRRTGRYLLISGVIVHLLAIAVFVHFRASGATPHRYITKVAKTFERQRAPVSYVGDAVRSVFLHSGLVADPLDQFPPDLTIPLPRWRGLGANALRPSVVSRYTADGRPIASVETDLWSLATPSTTRRIHVDTHVALRDAVANAQPGDEIILGKGRYRLDRPLRLNADGTATRPLVIRGEHIGGVVLELGADAALTVSGAYWTVSDMVVRGQCGDSDCAAVVTADERANALVVRNLFVSGFETLVAGAGTNRPTLSGLLEGNTLLGTRRVTDLGLRFAEHAQREIDMPLSKNGFRVLCSSKTDDPRCDSENLKQALRKIDPGGLLLIRAGSYHQAAVLRVPGLHILAEPGALLTRKATKGMGALVVDKDVTIEGLECSYIKVRDGNGCCVRQRSGDITLLGVHFHHSQMGMLTGHKGGKIKIYDSYFHDSGYDESGQLGHNLYINSGTFEFIRSWSLAARNAGHALKSRASRTLIEDSLLGSLNARDSRLIDVPSGGILEIRDNLLAEGPRSENWELIGFGLEPKNGRLKHAKNTVLVENNTIYVDRPQRGRVVNAKLSDSTTVVGNVIIGDAEDLPGNRVFKSRADAGVGPYPELSIRH